jgi:hypothetical protein
MTAPTIFGLRVPMQERSSHAYRISVLQTNTHEHERMLCSLTEKIL